MIRLTLPYPPSANRYWRHNRGRTHRSKEANDYRDVVALTCRAVGIEPLEGNVCVELWAYRPIKRGDLDNLFKVLGDSMQGHVYHDDKQVVEIHAYRRDDKRNPRIELTIEGVEPTP